MLGKFVFKKVYRWDKPFCVELMWLLEMMYIAWLVLTVKRAG